MALLLKMTVFDGYEFNQLTVDLFFMKSKKAY